MANTLRNRKANLVGFTIIGFALVLGLSACTKRPSVANWQKAGVSQDQKARDIGECRRFARRETEREAGIPSTASSSDPLSGTQSYGRLTTNYDLGKFKDRMFAHCMKRSGYLPISVRKP